MQAKDVMSRPVFTLQAQDLIERAAALLTTHQITSAPVLDASGDLVGMVSEIDLLAPAFKGIARTRPGRPQTPAVVGDVMSQDVVIVAPDTDLADIAKAMIDFEVRCVPVVQNSELLGVISRRDLLRSTVRVDDVVSGEVQIAIDDYTGGQRRWSATVHDGVATIDGPFDDDAQRQMIAALAHSVPGVRSVQLPPERAGETDL